MTEVIERKTRTAEAKHDADYVFYELTRSICPECRRAIDAHILLRNNKVYMRKRCPEHGRFAGLGTLVCRAPKSSSAASLTCTAAPDQAQLSTLQ